MLEACSGSSPMIYLLVTSYSRNTEHAREKVLPAIEVTLRNLKLEYLDLYLVGVFV